ncbi:MAG: hypothetical protein AAFY26_12025 [Cyanobacteria bacterium J06638_22]
MSKRFSVTVPDAIGQVVERLAETEGSKAATTASFVLETAIKEGLQNGKYPKEWAVLSQQQEAEQQIDEVDRDSIADALIKLKQEKQLSSAEVALLEGILRLKPGTLAILATNGNGHEAPRT